MYLLGFLDCEIVVCRWVLTNFAIQIVLMKFYLARNEVPFEVNEFSGDFKSDRVAMVSVEHVAKIVFVKQIHVLFLGNT